MTTSSPYVLPCERQSLHVLRSTTPPCRTAHPAAPRVSGASRRTILNSIPNQLPSRTPICFCLGGGDQTAVPWPPAITGSRSFQLGPSGDIHATAGRRERTRSAPRRYTATRASSANTGVTEANSDDSWFSVRGGIIVGNGLALLLCNMCRVCMSVAILPLSEQLGWTASIQGLVLSVFLWGYASTQVLGGTLADKFGGKVVMSWGIVVFAGASMLVPLAVSPPMIALGLTLPLVVAGRTLVGLGEGVAMPSMNNLMATHIRPEIRGSTIGAVFAGFHSGTLLGLVLSPVLVAYLGWQSLFYIYGALGLPLLLLWRAAIPGPPKAAGGGGAAGGLGVYAALLRKPAAWACISANFVNHWGYFVYLNWMPAYFNKVIGFNLTKSTLFSFVPWLVMAVMAYVSGWLGDAMVERWGYSKIATRRILQTVAFLGPALALVPLATTRDPAIAVVCFSLALATLSFSNAGYLVNIQEIAPSCAGRLFGLCNTVGSLAGVAGTAAVGVIIDATGSWALVFQSLVAIYFCGVVAWNILVATDRIDV